MVLPSTFDDLIPSTHLVRIVNHVIDQIELNPFLRIYKRMGLRSYHPRILHKVLANCYLSNIYSSRKLVSAKQENIHFIWLSGMKQPDTIRLTAFAVNDNKRLSKNVQPNCVNTG